MNYGKMFAFGQIGLAILAAIGYAVAGDWRKAIYWVAAAVITAAVI